MRQRSALVFAAGLVAAGTGYVVVTNQSSSATSDDAIADAAPATTETVAVARQDLVETAEASGTVGNGTPTPLPIDAQGIVTSTPETEDVLSAGDVIVSVDSQPVFLADGETPLYRELRLIGSSERDAAGDKLGLQTGPDVIQLQSFLRSQGFDDDGSMDADGTFGASTKRAVKDWQKSVGHAATGRIDRTQLVFAATDLRVESAPSVGETFNSITVTEPSQIVKATVKASERDFFAVGATVSIDAGGDKIDGTVSKANRTTGQDGSTVYEIEVIAEGQTLPNSSVMDLTSSRVVVEDATTVPVRALLALAEGGWAVQVESATGTDLISVELGAVVDGTAEITGIEQGTDVVVPT